MNNRSRTARVAVVASIAAIGALVTAAAASAHAHVSPPISISGDTQLYSLAVPTEKEGATTTQIVLSVPKDFSIDSFVPSSGWKRTVQSTGTGENTVVQKVTWTGGKVPTEEDSLFQFLAEASNSGTYTFQVQQTYSDGSIVNWSGPESSDTPAPTIEAETSFGGGGGSSTLSIVALVVGAVGVILGGAALMARSGRKLA